MHNMLTYSQEDTMMSVMNASQHIDILKKNPIIMPILAKGAVFSNYK